MATKDFVYDAANEVLVLRAAVAYACSADPQEQKAFRSLVHSIGPDEFLVAKNCALWRVFRKIADGGLTYSYELVRQLLSTEGAEVSETYLDEIDSERQIPPNLEWHIETLRWDATRARVFSGSLAELVADMNDPRVAVDRAVSTARAVVRALEGGAGRRFIRRPDEIRTVYTNELRRRRTEGNFYPSGFDAVDGLMSEGFMPGNTAIVTGLSGCGKSTFAAKLAVNLARIGRKPLMCVWEMGSISTFDLMMAILTGIRLDDVVKGRYTDEQLRRLDRATAWVAKHIRFMENAFFGAIASEGKQRRSNQRNLDILEGYIAESGCDEIIMDLWDRLLADQSPDAVTDALYRQQNMHREYNVHGTLLVQLRLKDVEKRADKRPTRESIKGVGTFVEVADLIFGVHRDAQFKDVPDNTLELICLKQRKGKPNWAVRFGWDGTNSQITGGEEVPYNPGLEASSEFGELADPSAIRTRPRKGRIRSRDGG